MERPRADERAELLGHWATPAQLLQEDFPAWLIYRDGVSWCARGETQTLTAPTVDRLRALLEADR
ncbi:hypothetical protein ACQEU5_25055 [Marinactinospora thermotolerans]|uniref:hypothetical protein n=1 Tax=Marinactinospora thermotolerans TaxID=531310 RepID=UPI003D8CDCE8